MKAWMALLLTIGQAAAWDFVDVEGVPRTTSTQNVIIVFLTVNCAPADWMVMDTVAPLKRRYPEILPVTVFPRNGRDEVREWRSRVPGASNVVSVVVPLWDPMCELWASAGFRNPATFLYNEQGVCLTNWLTYHPRRSIEPVVTRPLLKLRIGPPTTQPERLSVTVSPNVAVSWRDTDVEWRLTTNRMGNFNCYQLTLP